MSHQHSSQYPLNSHSSTWKGPATPSITPVVTTLPPPIVIAPADVAFDPGISATDPLSLLAPTNACVETPAVAMMTETRGKVPRPITGRGYRDQLLATTVADNTVSLYLMYLTEYKVQYQLIFNVFN